MASPRFTSVKSSSASRWLLIVPVKGQKVKCVSPSPLEVGIRSREQEPARTADRTAIAAGFGHNLNARLKEVQSLCGGDIGAQAHSVSDEGIDAKLMVMTHDLIAIAVGGGQIT